MGYTTTMDNATKMNGFLRWGQKSLVRTQMMSYADMSVYRIPFVLSTDTAIRLGQMNSDEAAKVLSNLMWSAVSLRNSSGGIVGSSYGSVSYSIEEVEYVPGLPCGHVTVGQSVGIGD